MRKRGNRFSAASRFELMVPAGFDCRMSLSGIAASFFRSSQSCQKFRRTRSPRRARCGSDHFRCRSTKPCATGQCERRQCVRRFPPIAPKRCRAAARGKDPACFPIKCSSRRNSVVPYGYRGRHGGRASFACRVQDRPPTARRLPGQAARAEEERERVP